MALDFISKSIRNKLMMITGLATTVVVGTAIVGFWYAWSSVEGFQGITDGAIANERTALIMVTEFKKQVQEWKDTLLRGSDPQKLEKYWGQFLKQEEKIQTLGDQLQSHLTDQDAKDLVEQFIAAHKTMGQAYRKGLDAYKASGFVSHVGDTAVAGIDRAPTQLLEKAAKLVSNKSNSLIDESLRSARQHIVLSLGVMLIAVVIASLFFLWFIQQFIVNPSRQLREDLARMASGNFTHRIESVSKDEIGQIADSAQHLQEELGETIGHLSGASRQVSDSSRRLTVVVEHTSQGVTQQRQQTDMVATAMNEMVATVQEVTRSASRAAESAYNANQEANAGKQVIATTTDAIDVLAADVEKAAQVIHKLEENSNAIGSVLDVIRGIAEQTNLLALNAAIEAARAGEQGRGFAVVADEVRTLAQRTQQSTREIQDMIEQLQAGTREAVTVMSESQGRAKSTVEHALKAGEALETIVNTISAISDMNSQIATAAEEQSTVAEEIGRNIVAISQAAEQSAESAEQTSQSSEELADLANQLQSVAARFQI
jgi:methyl-accepting chemotaxis protein